MEIADGDELEAAVGVEEEAALGEAEEGTVVGRAVEGATEGAELGSSEGGALGEDGWEVVVVEGAVVEGDEVGLGEQVANPAVAFLDWKDDGKQVMGLPFTLKAVRLVNVEPI